MTFDKKIYEVLNSITGLTISNIYYLQIPDNKRQNDSIVFSYFLNEQIDTLAKKNVLKEYRLNIGLLSKNLDVIKNNFQTLMDFFIDYKDDQVRAAYFESEKEMMINEENIFVKSVEFNVFYKD